MKYNVSMYRAVQVTAAACLMSGLLGLLPVFAQPTPELKFTIPTAVAFNDTFSVLVSLNSPPDTMQSVRGMIRFDDVKLDYVDVAYHSSIPTACGGQQNRSGCWFHFTNPANDGADVFLLTSDDFSTGGGIVIGGCPDAGGSSEWDPVYTGGADFQYAVVRLRGVAAGQSWVEWKNSSDYEVGYAHTVTQGSCAPGIDLDTVIPSLVPAKGVRTYIQVLSGGGGGGGGGGELSKPDNGRTWSEVKALYDN